MPWSPCLVASWVIVSSFLKEKQTAEEERKCLKIMIGKLAEEAARWGGGQSCGWEMRLGEYKSEEDFGVSIVSVFVSGPQHKMCYREVLHRPHKQSPQSSSETHLLCQNS